MPRRRAAADLSWERESRAGGRESDDGSELGKERDRREGERDWVVRVWLRYMSFYWTRSIN